jgi:TolA-binding protein
MSPATKVLRIAWQLVVSAFLAQLFLCGELIADDSCNRLYRMEVQKKENYTRFVFAFASPPRYTITHLPGRRVLLTFLDTCGPLLKKGASYSDSRVEGLRFSDQGNRLVFGFTVKERAPGFRFLDICMPNLLTLDVGESLQMNGAASMPPEREQIWKGAGKLIRDFDPPLPSEIPFFPTPGPTISKLLSGDELKLFLRGEDALYRERGAEAEEIFSGFLQHKPMLRAIAAFRLGEAQYQLQKYESALRWFREGEKLWPGYLVQSPSMVFAYADTLSRCGESAAGRKILERMIAGMTETKYGPILLVRLADITARGGREMDAVAVYHTVAETFGATRAGYLAATRLADRRLFAVNSDTYRALAAEYRKIHEKTSDPILKEQALFKSALITSLYGFSDEAVTSVAEYQKKFPNGIFANVAATMREDLLLCRYHELDREGDCRSLVKFVLENRDYLARCVGESEFIPRIAACFRKLGMVREELSLFSFLADSVWAGSHVPFLYLRIHEDAWTLGELAIAEAAGKLYLASHAVPGTAKQVLERIGWIQYRNGDMAAVAATLSPLLKGKPSAADPASYYYLGKACENLRDLSRAEKSLDLYLASLPQGTDTTLTADARIVLAAAKLSRNDAKGALEIFRAGYESARDERRDMFLYKMGEVLLAMGSLDEACSRWQQLVKEGKDPVWKSLAIQALADQAWRREWGR